MGGAHRGNQRAEDTEAHVSPRCVIVRDSNPQRRNDALSGGARARKQQRSPKRPKIEDTRKRTPLMMQGILPTVMSNEGVHVEKPAARDQSVLRAHANAQARSEVGDVQSDDDVSLDSEQQQEGSRKRMYIEEDEEQDYEYM